MPVFPTLSKKPDAKTYKESAEDQGMGSDMEGGYRITRPRHTRKPRRTFSFQYSDLSLTDKIALDDFIDLVKGTSDSFTWTRPYDAKVFTVRFIAPLPELEWANAHKLTNGTMASRWNTTEMKLETV